jgi:predicted nuclease of predicted toxin-antitoxin system
VRLIFDAHIPLAVAEGLTRAGAEAITMPASREGRLRTAKELDIRAEAKTDGRMLVTFDLRTIPRLIRVWAAEGRSHAGVILVDDKTIRPNDIGGLIRALLDVVNRYGNDAWTNRVIYLQAVRIS